MRIAAARRWLSWFFLCLMTTGMACATAGRAARADDTPRAFAPETADVLLRDVVVFTLHRGDAYQTCDERARRASRRLTEAAAQPGPHAVRFSPHGDEAVILVGTTPIVTLQREDAALSREASLPALAQRIASQVQAALAREHERAVVAQGVFSVSLVVFFGLVTLYLARKLATWTEGGRTYLSTHARNVSGLHLRGLEVLGPVTVRNGLLVLLGVGRWFGLLGLAYAWVVVSLSMFDATRPLVEKLTGVVLAPMSALAGRVAAALPMLVIVLVAAVLVGVLVRTTELLFASIARGEARVDWVSPEVAPAASVIVRAGLVLGACVFVGPIITGDADGPLSRTAFLALGALALSMVPLVTSILAGLALVLSRTLHEGDRVEYGGRTGTVRALGLLAIVLADDDDCTVRVPHLLSLWHPTKVHPRSAS